MYREDKPVLFRQCRMRSYSVGTYVARPYLAPSSNSLTITMHSVRCHLLFRFPSTTNTRATAPPVLVLCSTNAIFETDRLMIVAVASRAIRHSWHNGRQAQLGRRRPKRVPNLFCCLRHWQWSMSMSPSEGG